MFSVLGHMYNQLCQCYCFSSISIESILFFLLICYWFSLFLNWFSLIFLRFSLIFMDCACMYEMSAVSLIFDIVRWFLAVWYLSTPELQCWSEGFELVLASARGTKYSFRRRFACSPINLPTGRSLKVDNFGFDQPQSTSSGGPSDHAKNGGGSARSRLG